MAILKNFKNFALGPHGTNDGFNSKNVLTHLAARRHFAHFVSSERQHFFQADKNQNET